MRIFNHVVPRMHLITILLLIAVSAASAYAARQIPYAMVAAVATCIIADFGITHFYHRHGIRMPYAAIITGLIIGAVAPISGPIPLAVLAALIAVIAKHFMMVKRGNIFNPAAFGLIVSLALFGLGDEWWAASAYSIHAIMIPISAVFLLGAYEAKRLTTGISYIAVSFVLGILASAALSGVSLAGAVTSLITMNYFFALVMLVDPKTSPVKAHVQAAFGAGMAVIVFAFSMLAVPYALLAALLSGNAIYAVYRFYRSR